MKKKNKANRMVERFTFQHTKYTFKMAWAKKLKNKDAYHVFAAIRDHIRNEIEFWGGPYLG
jgi:hypothetical protein